MSARPTVSPVHVCLRLLTAVMLLAAAPVRADMGAPPPIGFAGFDRLELRDADDADTLAWEFDAWWGTPTDKLWLKSDGERVEGETEGADLQLLYSRALTPFWDLQLGGRVEAGPHPHRGWLVAGFEGLAPGFIDTEAALFIADRGRTALRASFERELLITQRLWLAPELEFELYGREDESRGVGAGLSAVEASLRLGYTLHRKFAPYLGIQAERLYRGTADFAGAEGEPGDRVQFFVGVQAWF